MTIIEKKDTKNHLSLRHNKDIFLCAPLSQPDATGYSCTEADETRANQSAFASDYSVEHTIAFVPPIRAVNSTGSTDVQLAETSKSAQA
jgi:hypothetical protein